MNHSNDGPAVLCLAHLSWDHVWQRPQHVLSRVARRFPVLYINEPYVDGPPEGSPPDKPPRLELVASDGQLEAWQPVFPNRREVLDAWRPTYARLVAELLHARGWLRAAESGWAAARPLITWFYTPTPYYLLDSLPADVVVYDVMDELSNFRGASVDLKERAACLLSQADLVLTGGRALYEARVGQHPNLHLFASGVEPEHFEQALWPETLVAPEIARLSWPVLGYMGVIDERLDLDLLRRVAVECPEWSIALVGPVAKIREEDLPRLPNLHYLGKQPYARLPNFLKGFDVCLMPFAMNDATRFISPTKTLEYMAAHKPIVSTPVPDVVRNWGHVVRIAADAGGFVHAVEQALAEDAAAAAHRGTLEQEIVARNTWDRIATDMLALIEQALEDRQALPEGETA